MTFTQSHTHMSRSSREAGWKSYGSRLLLIAGLCGFSPSAAAQIAVIGSLSHDRDVVPGATYDGAVTVKNDTETEQEVKIYQRDYFFTSDGKNLYGDPGRLPRSNAPWITFAPSSTVLPPKGTANITYTVAVPPDSVGRPLSGSYWSMLMVESLPPGSPESSLRRKDSTTVGLFQNIRYAIQIATHIANTGERMARFLDVKLTKNEEGKRMLQVDVENSGTLYMKPDVSVELFAADGQSRGKIPGGKFRMYPGTSVRHLLPLGEIPPGTYKALVVVDAGGADVFGAQYTLKF